MLSILLMPDALQALALNVIVVPALALCTMPDHCSGTTVLNSATLHCCTVVQYNYSGLMIPIANERETILGNCTLHSEEIYNKLCYGTLGHAVQLGY